MVVGLIGQIRAPEVVDTDPLAAASYCCPQRTPFRSGDRERTNGLLRASTDSYSAISTCSMMGVKWPKRQRRSTSPAPCTGSPDPLIHVVRVSVLYGAIRLRR